MTTTKQCSACGAIKGLDEFYANRAKADGKCSACKQCMKERKSRDSAPQGFWRMWTDDELGYIEDSWDIPLRFVAEHLGRSKGSVSQKRKELRRGVMRSVVAWTVSELAFITDNPNLTDRDIASAIGRTASAVKQQRHNLAASGLAHISTPGIYTDLDPFRVRTRTLVARTCKDCGLLLDSSWFVRYKNKTWSGDCRKCRATSNGADSKRTNGVRNVSRSKLQAVSLQFASNRGKEWTDSDLRTLEDTTLTTFQKAIKLGRTYSGVQAAVSRFGLAADRSLDDPTDAQWLITLHPDIAAMFQQRAA